MARPKKQKPVPALAAIPEPMFAFDRMMSYSNGEGVMSSIPVQVNVNGDGRFSLKLPPHLVAHCNRTDVYADRLVDLVQEFEQINEDYSITTLHGKAAKPMLLVTLRDEIRADARHVALLDVGVMMGVIQVSVNPAVPERIYRREDDKTLTILVNTESAKPYILLPDTPEINDRLQAMSTSIENAASVLRALIDAPDPAAVLLSMTGPWTPKVDGESAVLKVIADNKDAVKALGPFASDDEI